MLTSAHGVELGDVSVEGEIGKLRYGGRRRGRKIYGRAAMTYRLVRTRSFACILPFPMNE